MNDDFDWATIPLGAIIEMFPIEIDTFNLTGELDEILDVAAADALELGSQLLGETVSGWHLVLLEQHVPDALQLG